MVIKWQVPRNALYRRLYWKGTPATRHLGRFDSVLLLCDLRCSTLVCLLVQQGFIDAPVMSRQ